MSPLWARELAAAFWRRAGADGSFPRDLQESILRAAFNLTVEKLPHLTIGRVSKYLARFGLTCDIGQTDRPLRGCLVARSGAGFIFLDARDSPDESRFSLAHELAHFLRDYWQPRTRAVKELGQPVLEVLDGRRLPTVEERFHSMMRNVPIGFHTHLMSRDDHELPADVASAEFEADVLAFELLAPADAILEARSDDLAELLCTKFGLPKGAAEAYGEMLTPPALVDPLWRRLRNSGNDCRTSRSQPE